MEFVCFYKFCGSIYTHIFQSAVFFNRCSNGDELAPKISKPCHCHASQHTDWHVEIPFGRWEFKRHRLTSIKCMCRISLFGTWFALDQWSPNTKLLDNATWWHSLQMSHSPFERSRLTFIFLCFFLLLPRIVDIWLNGLQLEWSVLKFSNCFWFHFRSVWSHISQSLLYFIFKYFKRASYIFY